jgi:hypothetical protein
MRKEEDLDQEIEDLLDEEDLLEMDVDPDEEDDLTELENYKEIVLQ